MKTKFFKKLSFVLVVAMVLSLFVPAAGAFAAAGPKLNSTNKYLHLGVDKLEEFNFNISNKQKGWKYHWESANENVAVVNEKNGVTVATGVGKTKITVDITDLDKNTITLSATVTVRDNIETVTIKNPVDTLGVGEEHDYNRDFVTVSGSTKKTGAITRWTVEPSETATIDDKGVFVATEADEYTITARSFQSGARYKNWLEDADKYADEVLATDETTVVVAGAMIEAKQESLTKFNVEFDSVMDEDEVKENLKVYVLLGTAESPQYVKSISLDDKTSTVATVEMYGDFNKGMTYVAKYPDMDNVSFKATSTNYTDVVRMTIDTKGVVAAYEGGEEKEIEFTLFNADGVDITNGTDADFNGKLADRVSFETDSTGAYIYEGKKLTIFEVGTVAQVKGTYNTYVYDDQGKEIGTVNAVAPIVGTKDAVVGAGSLDKYTVTLDGDGPDWDEAPVTRVAIGADQPKLWASLKDSDDEDVRSDAEDAAVRDNFNFESSNDNVLFVAPNGDLYPVKEGSVVVVIKYNDTIVGYANITVVPESKAAAYTLSDYSFTLSTAVSAEDSKKVTVTLKDQYGNNAKVDKPSVKALETSNSVSGYIIVDETDLDDKEITFKVDHGSVVEAGKAVYEVEYNGMKRTVTITLADPNHTADNVRYRLELSKEIDLEIEEEEDLEKTLDIKLIGYAPNGVKVTTDKASEYDIEITGKEEDLEYNSPLYKLDPDAVSGSAINKIETGTYKVVAKDGDKVLDTQYFTVKDSQKPATLKIDTVYFTAATLEDIADECFEIKIDGNDHDGIVSVDAGEGIATDSRIFIKTITVKQKFGDDGNYIEHEVKVNLTVYKK